MTTNDTTLDVRLPRPRIRTGAIVWGLIVTLVGAGALALLLNPELRDATIAAILSLSAFGFGLAVLAGLGLLILVLAIVTLIRRAQQRAELRHIDALAGNTPGTAADSATSDGS